MRTAILGVLIATFLLGTPHWTAAQSATSAPASSAARDEQLRQGPATFDAAAPAALEVKKARTGHLLVRPLVNGQPAGWFIFDTGAGVCCVATARVDELKLERHGEIQSTGGGGGAASPLYRARELRLGPLTCTDHPLMGVDLAFLETHLGEPISGIVGFGVLTRCVAVVDLTTPTIALYDPAHYQLAHGAWTSLDLSARVPVVTARAEGHEGRFLLDTGDHGHLSFNEPTVRKWDLLAGRDVTDRQLGGVGGFIAAKQGTVAKLEFGGLTLTDVPASFALEAKGTYGQTERAGKIGAGVLERFVLVVDYGQQRLALQARDKAGTK
jgi:predicted aspartyl protease